MKTRRGFSFLPAPLALTAAAAGLSIGLGAFAFHYAKGTSYLGNDPATCANCHVMQGYYDAWLAGPHHHAATCNDCHTPAGFVGKYWVKSTNGYHHSTAFTFGGYPHRVSTICCCFFFSFGFDFHANCTDFGLL